MEEGTRSDNHLTSAAAFVEGGIQDACDDTCSICLEEFCDSDPSAVTGCKHEFHLQCILEWCQRSSQCPMCWQDISLKDPNSQELLDAIEQEKIIRNTPQRNTTIFHHPTLGEFELQHLPDSATDAELEERIIQHLAAAAAMGRARQIGRREGQRSRPSVQGRPQYLVFSTHPNGPNASASLARREGESSPAVTVGLPSLTSTEEESSQPVSRPPSVQGSHVFSQTSVSNALPASPRGSSSTTRRSPTQFYPNSHDTAGPSELQSFSESLKARINTFSVRYKESITKSMRGWKERLFSHTTSIADPPEGRRDSNSGVATVSSMMDRLNARESTRTYFTSGSNALDDGPHLDQVNRLTAENLVSHAISENNILASSAAPTTSD